MPYPVVYTRLLARQLKLDETGQRELLTGTGLTPGDLASLEREISDQDQIIIVHNAFRLTSDPASGLELGQRIDLWLWAHGSLGSLFSASPNLGEAFAVVERYISLRVPGLKVWRTFEPDDCIIHLQIQPPFPLEEELICWVVNGLMVAMQEVLDRFAGRPVKEAHFCFAHDTPSYVARYAHYLHSPCTFACESNAVRIPRVLLEQPNPFRDSAVYTLALRQQEQLEAQARLQSESWSARVLRLLQQNPGQLWTLSQIAEHCHLSTRTLNRHLKTEGTGYQKLLDEELARQARACLESPRHTVESMALTLGYQDVSAFRRAFKRWFGMSPSEYLDRNRVG